MSKSVFLALVICQMATSNASIPQELSLHQACRVGALSRVQDIVAQHGHECLLELGQEIPGEGRDNSGMLPLALAASHLHAPLIDWILCVDYVPDWPEKEEFFKRLVNAQDAKGNTFLHHLAVCSEKAVQKKRRYEPCLSAIFRCCHWGHKDEDKRHYILAEAVDIQNKNRDTPALAAAVNGRTAMLRELAAHGADLTYANGLRGSVVTAAAGNGHFETARTLIGLGAPITARHSFDETLLHLAVRQRNAEFLEWALENGGCQLLDKQDRRGETPLDYAYEPHMRDYNFTEGSYTFPLAQILLDYGAERYDPEMCTQRLLDYQRDRDEREREYLEQKELRQRESKPRELRPWESRP